MISILYPYKIYSREKLKPTITKKAKLVNCFLEHDEGFSRKLKNYRIGGEGISQRSQKLSLWCVLWANPMTSPFFVEDANETVITGNRECSKQMNKGLCGVTS